ncbi:coiled-coil domain-containing protein [Forsythia ovata]|uniref:Vacuolar ATPase assembly protein VMA22 n=1 Tax=Forsythia ovata TaxID=205694 RepID=A0ABD1UBY7_9LAMI
MERQESSENGRESNEGISVKEENILNFLDSVDGYLILMDSLSSTLRQGWLELASARHSMGASRINSTLFDHKLHPASTTLQVNEQSAGPDRELPHFTLCKWASSNNPEKYFEEAKFGEDELLKKSNSLRHRDISHNSEIQARSPESVGSLGSPVTVDDQAQKERYKSLSMFGTLVSPKLRASQLSFETALEMVVEISNMRASLLSAAVNHHRRDPPWNLYKTTTAVVARTSSALSEQREVRQWWFTVAVLAERGAVVHGGREWVATGVGSWREIQVASSGEEREPGTTEKDLGHGGGGGGSRRWWWFTAAAVVSDLGHWKWGKCEGGWVFNFLVQLAFFFHLPQPMAVGFIIYSSHGE